MRTQIAITGLQTSVYMITRLHSTVSDWDQAQVCYYRDSEQSVRSIINTVCFIKVWEQCYYPDNSRESCFSSLPV